MNAGRDHVTTIRSPRTLVAQGLPPRRPAYGLVALLVLLPSAAPVATAWAAAEAPGQTLKRVEQAIQADKARQQELEQQSQSLQQELEGLRGKLVGMADEERAQEDDLSQLENQLSTLEDQERERSARLDGERQEIARLLGALQRLSRIPPEALLARPDGPVDTLRSALLLRDAVPELRARADALAAALKNLADTREKLESQRTRTLAARVALAQRQSEIARLVARREALSRQTEDERLRVGQHSAQLAAQATDLRQLMDRIEAERRATAEAAARREAERLEAERKEAERKAAEQKIAEQKIAEQRAAAQKEAAQKELDRKAAAQQLAERKATEQREAERRAKDAEIASAQRVPEPPPETPPETHGGTNGLRQPVGGSVTLHFGQTDRFGATSRGITIRARAGSTVVAPRGGTVVFAGPFRGYGQILIVEHGNGYHSLLAGFGRIDTAVGKRVASGEPVGLMPADGSPDLYFELRRNGQPINPQKGFGTPEGKGQG